MRIGRKEFNWIRWDSLNQRGKWIRSLSLALAGLCIALAVLSVNMLGERNRQDEHTRALLASVQATPDPTQAQSTSTPAKTQRSVVLQDVDGYAVIAKISINKLSLELPIVDQTTDEALKVAPCLYSGPATPADDGNMVVTAHNNKDGSQFGKLKELKASDTVTLMDKWGDTFTYEIYDIETITSDNVAALEEYEGEKALSLLTCTSNGNRRLLLRCRMVDNAAEATGL